MSVQNGNEYLACKGCKHDFATMTEYGTDYDCTIKICMHYDRRMDYYGVLFKKTPNMLKKYKLKRLEHIKGVSK